MAKYPTLRVFGLPVNYQCEAGLYNQPLSLRLTVQTADYVRRAIVQALYTLTEAENWIVQPNSGGDIEAAVAETARLYSLMEFRGMSGQVAFFAGDIPDNYHELDGSVLAVSDYPDLADTCSQWVDGSDILLPDYRGKFVVSVGGGYSLEDTGGEASHTLTSLEMPAHSHSEISATPTLIAIGAGVPAPSAIPGISTTGLAGGGQSHNNLPPYVAFRMAVSLW